MVNHVSLPEGVESSGRFLIVTACTCFHPRQCVSLMFNRAVLLNNYFICHSSIQGPIFPCRHVFGHTTAALIAIAGTHIFIKLQNK